jgi:formylglycine-generating enzyme required for sulfatase activity
MRIASTILILSAALIAFLAMPSSAPAPLRVAIPDLVELPAGAVRYRASGDFIQDRTPVRAPVVTATIPRTLAIMRHQVTQADYRRCVDAGACPMLDRETGVSNHALVNASWRDAQAYASWLSHASGTPFRLPRDEEWVYAAADRFRDEEPGENAYGGDPGRRALAMYDLAASREVATQPLPIGSFGANRNGLLDMAGNISEWTDTCFARIALDAHGEPATTIVDCGLRLVTGRHRAYLPDFIRDARVGGCTVGAQISNLGFRLVRDDVGAHMGRRHEQQFRAIRQANIKAE